MCGIAGIIHRNGRPVTVPQIERMLDPIQHRGPDDRGLYLDGYVGLGHQRLSIIDIEGGHQPMGAEGDRVQIIYNGELYNFRELREDLKKIGVQFRTQSDTEVVLAAYVAWGTDCIERFNGIFAFAIWDSRSRTLVLARDGAGVKPLYYYIDNDRLMFSSEIKSILSEPLVPRGLDKDALDAYLTFRYVPAPDTLIKGVSKLVPGHALLFSDNQVTLENHESPALTQNQWEDEGALKREVFQQLSSAVERQMVSDVDVGLLLSGGVDSCALLAFMSEHARVPVKTFTVGFEGDAVENETSEARQAADYFEADHHEVLMGALDYRDMLPAVIEKLEEPVCTTSIIPFHFLAEMTGSSVKVALSGQGADEGFAGYTRYLGERFGGSYRALPGFVRRAVSQMVNAAPLHGETLRRAVRALGHADVGRRFVESYSVYSQGERRSLYADRSGMSVRDHSDLINAVRSPVSGLNGLDQMLFVDVRVWLPNDLLLYTDKLSMAQSLEVRVPFLDLEFLKFVESVPATWKLRGLSRKYILKEAVRHLLPPGVADRKKKGFPTPMGRWLQSELAGYARDLLLASDSACCTMIDRKRLCRMIDAHVRGRRNYERQIFTLLVFEIWHQTFLGSSN
jgi:asparagine synthase (glutamine-hydrolysing)